MYTPAARRGTSLLVALLLLIAILLEQSIAGLCPWLSEMGGIRPMFVFLDIPVRSPVIIDWIPVGFIFIFFYSIVTFPRGKDKPKENSRNKSWAILGRWWLLLICLLAGGGLFYELTEHLPKQVRNGIDSFGIRADLILPYPSAETIHLQGGMILLVFSIIGWRLLVKKAVWTPAVVTAEAATASFTPAEPAPAEPASRMPAPPLPVEELPADNPGRGRITMRIPEPVEVKTPAPRRCVSVIMPATIPRRQGIYPCIVEGEVKPAGARKKELLK